MKKLYLPFLLFFCFEIHAQAYYPLLDSMNDWSYARQEQATRLMPPPNPCSYPAIATGNFHQYAYRDTLINSTSYKIVQQSFSYCTMGYIREDTAAQKVYFLPNNSPVEVLLYDFSMQPGDTLSINFISPGAYASGVYTLDSIGSITIEAGTRRIFYLACHNTPSSPVLSWIESAGNTCDLLYPYFWNTTGPGIFNTCPGAQHAFTQFLICFSHLSRVYYDACSLQQAITMQNSSIYTDTCDYYTVLPGGMEETQQAQISAYPNPVNGKVTLAAPGLNGAVKAEVYAADGRLIILQNVQAEKNISLDFTAEPAGIYLVRITSAQGVSTSRLIKE